MLFLSGCGPSSVDLKDALTNPFTKAEVACSLPATKPELEKLALKCKKVDLSSNDTLATQNGLLKACNRYLRVKANSGVYLQRSVKKYKNRCMHKGA